MYDVAQVRVSSINGQVAVLFDGAEKAMPDGKRWMVMGWPQNMTVWTLNDSEVDGWEVVYTKEVDGWEVIHTKPSQG